jgi:hypothetical protein
MDGPDPPDGDAHSGVEDFSGDCSPDTPGNCDQHAPNACLPAAGVGAVASFVCARGHRASPVPGRPPDPDPIVRAAVAPGWDSRWRLTAGNRGAGTRIPSNGTGLPQLQRGAARPERAERGPNTRRTARHPWRAASTNLRCNAQLGAPLGSPSPRASPHLVQRDAMPKVGASPCRGALPLARPDAATLSRLRVVPYRAAGPPDSRQTRRTRPRQPTLLAVATTPRAVFAVHLWQVPPNPERCGGVIEPSRPGESHTPTLRASLNQGGAPSPPKTARRPGWAKAWPLRVARARRARGCPLLMGRSWATDRPLLLCGRSIRLPVHPFARGAQAAWSHSVRRATVVSPPRGGRCPCTRRRIVVADRTSACHTSANCRLRRRADAGHNVGRSPRSEGTMQATSEDPARTKAARRGAGDTRPPHGPGRCCRGHTAGAETPTRVTTRETARGQGGIGEPLAPRKHAESRLPPGRACQRTT